MNHDLVDSTQSSIFFISEVNKDRELIALLGSFPVCNSLSQFAAFDVLNSSLVIIATKVYNRCQYGISEAPKVARLGNFLS
jgi:hypothetical protein